LTPANNVVVMSNRRILDRDVVNFRYKGEDIKFYRYGIEMSFDNSLPSKKTEKIEEILNTVVERYAEKLPRKPEYDLTGLTRLDRTYMLYIYVEDPHDVVLLRPTILREVTKLWDAMRAESS
jgi:hypothetical protein